MKIIGILGLQGAIVEHEKAIMKAAENIGTDIQLKRLVLPEDLNEVDGIIMPGGESTAMILIGSKNGMLDAVRNYLKNGGAAFGTCAGAILLSKNVKRNENFDGKEGAFPFMDTEILRNGYGRQIDSFSTDLKLKGEVKLFKGIFIRAPIINSVGKEVETLMSFKDKPVMVRQGKLLATTFHPELTEDTRIHEIFLKII